MVLFLYHKTLDFKIIYFSYFPLNINGLQQYNEKIKVFKTLYVVFKFLYKRLGFVMLFTFQTVLLPTFFHISPGIVIHSFSLPPSVY